MRRSTHSLATLHISKAAYEEIANKLLALGQGQSFLIKGHWDCLEEEIACGRAMIDLHGIALVLEQEEEGRCVMCNKPTGKNWDDRLICYECACTSREEEIEVKSELSSRDKNYHITETEEIEF